MLAALGVGVAGFCVVLFLWDRLVVPGFNVNGKHVIITGGSTGLGLAIALKCAAQGARVSLISRSQKNLQAAQDQILRQTPNARVAIFPCDVTNYVKVEEAITFLTQAQERVCDVLVCSAGLSFPGYFLEQPIEKFHEMMNLNYFGTVNVVKLVAPLMAKERRGHVVLVSSTCGLLGLVGYSQYCPTKFAIRGFADCIRNEFVKYGLKVSIFYPANMSTPGFEQEELTKPHETRTIEGTASMQTADEAAEHLFTGLRRGRYAISNDFITELLRMSTCGAVPRSSVLLEFVLAPFLVLLTTGTQIYMDYVTRKARSMVPEHSKQKSS